MLGAYSADAYIMESENYRLELDEIDMGAIGEMRDFSSPIQKGGSVLGRYLKESFGSPFSWELILGIVGGLLFLAFVCYFIVKKRLLFKQ